MTHVGIWGAGREGLAAARRYLANGHTVTVVSEADAPRPAALPADAVFYGGPAALSHLREADLVVISPGVPRVHPFRAELRDIPQTSVTDAWLASHADHTIGVTGTKGKSTTSTLVHALLTAAGVQARLGGNIGVPLMGLGDSPEPTVAELSSYQCASITRSPRIAVVTNLFEDHLTWHGSREAYWRDKARIFDHGACLLVCTPETARQFTALGYTLPPLRTPGAADHARIAPLALPEPLARPHNRANLVLALCAAEAWLGAELAPDVLVAACAAYEPLPHRLTLVRETAHARWIDDTLSTTVPSAIAALSAVPGPLVMIVGGLDRGIDYGPLTAALLARHPHPVLITVPTNGPRIAADYRAAHPDRVHDAPSLDDAVRLAATLTAATYTSSTGATTVILSPAAPSQDHYLDFAVKSAAFIAAIDALPAAATPHA